MKEIRRRQLEELHRVLSDNIITEWSLAIDGGANTGEWTAALAARFARVHAFEPQDGMVDLLRQRFPTGGSVIVHRAALMDHKGTVKVVRPKAWSTSTAYALYDPAGDTPAVTIDSLGLRKVGFIKLDLEGAEKLAIAGASMTIARYRPVLMVEKFGHQHRYGHGPDEMVESVLALGYEIHRNCPPDIVFVPRK